MSLGPAVELALWLACFPVIDGAEFNLLQRPVFLKKRNYRPNGFYWGHQCSWTFTPANSMQAFIMQSDDCNMK